MMPTESNAVLERMYQLTKAELEKIDKRYDPERDLIKDAPSVTYTDKTLLDAVCFLVSRVESLERDLRALKGKLIESGR
jgi:hypothetical protein